MSGLDALPPRSLALTPMPELVKETLETARARRRPARAHDEAPGGELEALLDDHAQHMTGLRAESHAHADLLRALRNGVGHHAVEADGGQQQGDGAEHGHEAGGDFLRIERCADELLERRGVKDGDVGIEARTWARSVESTLSGSPGCGRRRRDSCLRDRAGGRARRSRGRGFAEVVVLGILGDADDAEPLPQP
jgi:hypothetical protein